MDTHERLFRIVMAHGLFDINYIDSQPITRKEIMDAMKAAYEMGTADERERCAKLADLMALDAYALGNDVSCDAMRYVRDEIRALTGAESSQP